MGSSYDPADILYGGEILDLLIKRYGDACIYVPSRVEPERGGEGCSRALPAATQKETHSSWSNILDLVKQYRPQLINTGFSPDAVLNLLFQAALRLKEQEKLESIADEDPCPRKSQAVTAGVASSFRRTWKSIWETYYVADVGTSVTKHI